jgi:lipid-binding SYLF domain-containing protein
MKRRISIVAGMVLLGFFIMVPTMLSAKETPAERKKRIDEDAKEVLAKLFDKSKEAKALYNKSYGYAVFTATKVTVLASGGGGRGVAVEKKSGKRIYMKMATAGVGVGLGAQRTEFVFLFENKEVFDKFVEKGWQGGAGASAAAGNEGTNKAVGFKDGVAVYQFTKAGLVASADVTGNKFWKDDELN